MSLALDQPLKPVTAIVGGSKISTKIELLNNLSNKVEYLIIGGAMANTFLKVLKDMELANHLQKKDVKYCRENHSRNEI